MELKDHVGFNFVDKSDLEGYIIKRCSVVPRNCKTREKLNN